MIPNKEGKMKKDNRKLMVYAVLVALLALLLAACGPEPTPVVVKETVVVEKEVEVEKIVEKEVEKIVTEVVEVEVEKEVIVEVTAVPEQGQIFRVGMWSSPQSFNPYITTDDYSATLFENVYGQLIRLDANGAPVPYLAESFDVSEDGSEYTIHLRDNAFWHDGTPVTAKDVEMTYRLHGHPDVASIIAGNYKAIKGMEAYTAGEADSVEGLQIIDDKTIKFVLEEPNAPFINNLNYFVLPAHILNDVPPAELETHPYFDAPTVGAGAYKFVGYEPDQYMEFEAYEDFFLGAPNIQRLIYRIGTQDVLLAQLQKDELDFVLVPPAEVERIKSLYDISFQSLPGSGAQVMHFNLGKPYLQDKRVRQAMAYALPREDIIQPLYFGEATVVNSPNSIAWAVPDDLNPYEYNPEKAKELLAEAGWDPNQKLVLRYPTGNKPREMSAPLIQSSLKDVGIDVELQITDFATLLDDLKAGDYDLGLLGWTGASDPDLITTILYASENVPPAGWNIMLYSSEDVDELARAGRLAFDQEERAEVYQEMYRIINDDLPVVFLWSENQLYAYNDRLQGFEPSRFGSWAYLVSGAFPNIQDLTLSGE
jgi:peptide/nickel transport system substrate-binding protein